MKKRSTEILCHRFYWNVGIVGDGHGRSNKLSVKLLWEPRDLRVGIYWTKIATDDFAIYVCLLPCLPIRFHCIRAYGGIFPGAQRRP